MCKPDIGYEVMGGTFVSWRDVGGFPKAPCDDPDPGYKFSNLTPGTTYTMSVRAYRRVDDVKHYSTVSSMTTATLGVAPTPTPSPTPTVEPTPTPTENRARAKMYSAVSLTTPPRYTSA